MDNQIARLRAALGMTRTDFAVELGVVRTTVMRWEKNEMKPPSYIQGALAALAERHGVAWSPDPAAAPTRAAVTAHARSA